MSAVIKAVQNVFAIQQMKTVMKNVRGQLKIKTETADWMRQICVVTENTRDVIPMRLKMPAQTHVMMRMPCRKTNMLPVTTVKSAKLRCAKQVTI